MSLTDLDGLVFGLTDRLEVNAAMLEGSACQCCGAELPGEPSGAPRTCRECRDEAGADLECEE